MDGRGNFKKGIWVIFEIGSLQLYPFCERIKSLSKNGSFRFNLFS